MALPHPISRSTPTVLGNSRGSAPIGIRVDGRGRHGLPVADSESVEVSDQFAAVANDLTCLRHCGIRPSDRARTKPYDRTAYDLAAAAASASIASGEAALDGPKPIRTLMSPPFDWPAAP